MNPINFIARISSYLFHPIFYLTINLFLLMSVKPYWFGINHWSEKTILIILVAIYSVFIPGISILMLKVLGVIDSLELKDKHERIIPLIIVMIFNLWLWINLKQDTGVPVFWIFFILSTVVSVGLSLVINNWIKTSLHTVGIVTSLILWLILSFQHCGDQPCFINFTRQKNNFSIEHFIMILFIISGWIITSRLLLNAHNIKEIVSGIIISILSVIIAHQIIN